MFPGRHPWGGGPESFPSASTSTSSSSLPMSAAGIGAGVTRDQSRGPVPSEGIANYPYMDRSSDAVAAQTSDSPQESSYIQDSVEASSAYTFGGPSTHPAQYSYSLQPPSNSGGSTAASTAGAGAEDMRRRVSHMPDQPSTSQFLEGLSPEPQV